MRKQAPYYRQTWAAINLDAIHHNVSSYYQFLKKEREIMAVVKADGYGHGAIQVAEEALAAGATWLGVALLEEAIELRQAGIKAPILLMGYLANEYFSIAQSYDVSITITDIESFIDIEKYISAEHSALRFHLKIDTGMGRLGLWEEEQLDTFISLYKKYTQRSHPNLMWEGIFTHFATADERDQSFLERQISKFNEYVARLQQEKITVPYIHLSNSAGIFRTEALQYANLVRLGISMYGLYPSANVREELPFQLQEAFTLHTKLSLVKKVDSHVGISYGLTYRTKKEEWIGTLPIGYADGWDRNLSNASYVLIQGKRFPIVGRICMDQLMVRLDQEYSRDTPVTLIGKQGDQEIKIDDIANTLNTINYEIPCKLAKRVPRMYYKESQNEKQ